MYFDDTTILVYSTQDYRVYATPRENSKYEFIVCEYIGSDEEYGVAEIEGYFAPHSDITSIPEALRYAISLADERQARLDTKADESNLKTALRQAIREIIDEMPEKSINMPNILG